MSLRICTDEHFVSTSAVTAFALGALPRLVLSQRVESAHDGEVKQLSDPVAFMDQTLRWRNDTGMAQQVFISVLRAPRSFVVSSPNALAVTDSYGVAMARSTSTPDADTVLGVDSVRARRNDFRAPGMAYQITYDDIPGGTSTVCVGELAPDREVAFRYVARVSTPGNWRTPDTDRTSLRLNYAELSLYTALPLEVPDV